MKEAFEAMSRLLERVTEASQSLKNENLWWRGQPKTYLPLKPKIHRNRTCLDTYKEFNLIHNFTRQAPLRYSTWPKDRCHQLVLMQHYGLSTRLLDWSCSFLPALYFAVKDEEQSDEPASLWSLNPGILNRKQFPDTYTNIFHHNSHEVEEVVNSAFDAIFKGGNHVLAMSGPEVDLRMFAQWSVFTIHESPISMEDLQIELDEAFLHEIEIPMEDRCLLRQALEIFGISHSRLFPDLQSLAVYLESQFITGK